MSDINVIVTEQKSIIVETVKESQVIAVADQGPPGVPGPIVYLDYGKFDLFDFLYTIGGAIPALILTIVKLW